MNDDVMNDHDVPAARGEAVREPLTGEEEAQLERSTSPRVHHCRAIAAGMRRDDLRLRATLTPVPVAPRVRERVLAEAAGSRRSTGRVALLLAAALALGLIAVPFITGGSRRPSAASDSPSPSSAVVSSPSPASLAPSPASLAPSAPPGVAYPAVARAATDRDRPTRLQHQLPVRDANQFDRRPAPRRKAGR